jgi:hypothetical protein
MFMAKKSFPILTDEQTVSFNQIDSATFESFVELPLQHDRYFIVGPATVFVEMSRLVFSRARAEGVANANNLMREAAAGHTTRRKPITLRPLPDGRLQVVDGNSTAINGLLSDWYDIPAEFESSS